MWARRDQWIAAGAFDRLADEAIASYDRIIWARRQRLLNRRRPAPGTAGSEETRSSPVDRGKRGWKCSLFADWHGHPHWVATDGANRYDCVLAAPALAASAQRVALGGCQTLHLDRGYDDGVVRRLVADGGIDALVRAKGPTPRHGHGTTLACVRWVLCRYADVLRSGHRDDRRFEPVTKPRSGNRFVSWQKGGHVDGRYHAGSRREQ